MIEVVKQYIKAAANQEEKVNKMREFLQLLTLKITYDRGWFEKMAFVGGTALRFLFDVRRYSEDLDFSLIKAAEFRFDDYCNTLCHELGLFGLSVETKPKQKGAVHGTFLKFPAMLKAMGLSDTEKQKLSIKIEIDTNPPVGGTIETTFINKVYAFTITHFDLSTLFATKLHACFYRKFIKGRDFYDFLWYVGRKAKPNYTVLNNAIQQTTGKNPGLHAGVIKEFLVTRLRDVDFVLAKKDVERFLEDKSELKLFNFETFENAVIKM